MITKIKFTDKRATFKQAHKTDSGFDLTGCSYENKGNGLWMIDLGVQVQPPEGYYWKLVPRSSFSKTPFIFPHNVGIIDQNYLGNWMFPVKYFSSIFKGDSISFISACIEDQLIGKRIAQAVLEKRYDTKIEIFTGEWEQTDRGAGGFGSSGK